MARSWRRSPSVTGSFPPKDPVTTPPLSSAAYFDLFRSASISDRQDPVFDMMRGNLSVKWFGRKSVAGRCLFVALGLLVWTRDVPAQMMGSAMTASQIRSRQALLAWANGTDLDAHPVEPPPKFDNNLRLLGAAWYGQLCTPCHGTRGDGNGPRANQLSPRPRDFTKGIYEFRSTGSGRLATDADLWRTISDGLHGTAMVPWITFSEYDRWAMVAYIESLSPRFADEARAAAISLPTPPAENPQLVAKGKEIFHSAGCTECHGATGLSDGPSTDSLTDASGRPIHPIDFPSGVFRRGASMKDIFLTVRTGLDGTPMPSYADSLTTEQTWAVAAYVRSLITKPAPGAVSTAMALAARRQERIGMMIDMPGMGRMPMSHDPGARHR